MAGYGVPTGSYGQASPVQWASMEMIQGAVTDADIYTAIDSVKPVGTTIWTRLSD
ncbi:MAG TPA: hypothetical protein ACQGQI_04230 [Xylella sp.]